jgi:hypothetical protein
LFSNETLLAAGPLVYLRLDERSGTRIADASGNGNDGVLTPGGEDLGEQNERACGDDRAIRFRGNGTPDADTSTGGYVEVDRTLLPHPGDQRISFSVLLWYRYPADAVPQGVFPHFANVIGIGDSNSDQIAFIHDGYASGSGTVAVRPGSWISRESVGNGDYRAVTYPASEFPAPDTWHHLALTHDGELMRAYLDGQLSMIGAGWQWSNPTAWSRTTLSIGASGRYYSAPHASRFNGWVDDVAVFDRALSRAQIARVHEEAVSCACPPEQS